MKRVPGGLTLSLVNLGGWKQNVPGPQTITILLYVAVSYQSMSLDVMALRKGLDLVKFERTKQPDNQYISVSFTLDAHSTYLRDFKILVASFTDSGFYIRQGGYVFSSVVLLCLFVCVSVSNITQKVMNKLWLNFSTFIVLFPKDYYLLLRMSAVFWGVESNPYETVL